MKRLNDFINNISKPILVNIVNFIWLFLLVLAPSIVYWLQMPLDFLHIKYLILAIPVCFWSAYIFSVILYVFRRKFIRYIIFTNLLIFTFVECFLLIFFGTPVTEMIVQLLLGTNLNEVNGFLKSYILTSDFLKFILCICALTLPSIFVAKLESSIKAGQLIFVKILITLSVLFCGFLNVWRDVRFICIINGDDVQSIRFDRENQNYSKNYTTFGRLVWSVVINSNLYDDISRLKEVHLHPINVSSDYQSQKIVVIIGESFNRHHSSLYGYELRTNPLLEQEFTNGNLYVFNDVITPFNATYRVLKSILSFESQDNNINWTSYPLFPAIFKSLGYHVSFISNQEVPSEVDDVFALYNNYLMDDSIRPHLFDYTNVRKCVYDGELVRENMDYLKELECSNQLVIYHLLGQHMDYASRYPVEYNIFRMSDYSYRKDLNDYAKSVVAEYDNATLYNDRVISEILDIYRREDAVIIYFSDHGEEVYDFRNRAGRCHEEIISPERAKYEYQIPFMIWMSDEYKKSHPNVVNAISHSLDTPFMIDDLPHLLMDLAGIDYEVYDPSRSLVNGLYDVNRIRYLELSKQKYMNIKY